MLRVERHQQAMKELIQLCVEAGEWQFVYSDPSEETDAALKTALDIIMRHGEEHGFWNTS